MPKTKPEKKDKLIKTSHILKESDLLELARISEKEAVSVSALIRRAIAGYVKNYKKTAEI